MSKTNGKKQRIIDNYEDMKQKLSTEGYQEHQCTISMLKANVMVLVISMPIILVLAWIYVWKWSKFINFSFYFNTQKFIILFLFILVFIVLHEMVHGITWGFFCKYKWKSIHFGIMWDSLTPYCHCKEPLKFSSYILGALMPFLTLGIGIYLVSLIISSDTLCILGLCNVLAAGGDLTISLMLLRYKKAVLLDHPTECGFVAFEK